MKKLLISSMVALAVIGCGESAMNSPSEMDLKLTHFKVGGELYCKTNSGMSDSGYISRNVSNLNYVMEKRNNSVIVKGSGGIVFGIEQCILPKGSQYRGKINKSIFKNLPSSPSGVPDINRDDS